MPPTTALLEMDENLFMPPPTSVNEQEPFRKNFKTVASAPLLVDLMASPANATRLWHASCGLLVVLN